MVNYKGKFRGFCYDVSCFSRNYNPEKFGRMNSCKISKKLPILELECLWEDPSNQTNRNPLFPRKGETAMKAKTILAACLAAALTVFPLAGCSNSSDHNSSSGESLSSDGLVDQYPDGTYRAEASEFSHDWKEYVVVTVKDGKLTSVEFDAENKAKDAKKSDDEAYKQTMIDGNKANGKPETYPEKFYKELSDSLMNASGDVDKVETVAGATTSSNSFRALAKAALSKAREGDTNTAVIDTGVE